MAALDYEKLADYYDAIVTDESDVPFFRDLALRAGGPVAELMAGTGRVSVPLAEAGVDLTCVDSSTAMLAHLRARLASRGLRARCVEGDACTVDLGGRFHLVFVAFHSFQEIVDEEHRAACFRNVRRHLHDEGRFVCTLHDLPSRVREIEASGGGRWHFADPQTGRPLTLSLDTAYDSATHIVSGEECVRDAASDAPLLCLPIRFRLASQDELSHLAAGAGLRVVSITAGLTAEPYREGQCRTAVWTFAPLGLEP